MKRLWIYAVAAFLAIGMVAGESAMAQKSFSGGGSRTSSGSSSSRSSSSSSSSSSRSSSSSSSAKPSPAPSGGKSFSGGTSSSSGSKATVSPSPTPTKSPPPPSSSGQSGTVNSNSSNTSAKPKSSFGAGQATAQKTDTSRQSYQQYKLSQQPKSSYTAPDGKSQSIRADDPQVAYLRGRLDGERVANRGVRVTSYYGTRYDYYVHRPVIIYSDPYSSVFHWWLLEQSVDAQARWYYNHERNMDRARFDAAMAQNSQLRAQVEAMRAQNVARDPNFTPAGMDPDLQYNDAYVDAVANPQVVTVKASGGFFGWWCLWSFFGIVGLIILIAFIVSSSESNEA
jgi:hypothetical protein